MTEEINKEVETEVEVSVQSSLAKVGGFVVYKFEDKDVATNVASLISEDLLSEKPFTVCGKYDAYKWGFTPFSGEGEHCLLKTKGITSLQITEQRKTPKASTVRRKCKVAEEQYMKDNEVEKVDKETKEIIKLSVIESLIPTTDPDNEKTTLLWLVGEYLFVGLGKYDKAGDLVTLLRSVVGSVPVTPLQVEKDVTEELTKMLKDGYKGELLFGNKVVLTNPDSKCKGVVTFDRECLYEAEVHPHLDNGLVVDKVQLNHIDCINLIVNGDLEFNGVKVHKDVLAGAGDIGALIITMDEIISAVDEIMEVFGTPT